MNLIIKATCRMNYFLFQNRCKLSITPVLLFLSIVSFSQYSQEDGSILYGNEWIVEEQNYYSFTLAEDGIYRIGYGELLDAGIPVSQIESSKYQLYRIGEEQAIYISSSSNQLQSGDYIEFFGRRMREEFHPTLYENYETDQLNPYFNLITDTACYFLTWSNSEGKRYEEVMGSINSELDTLDYIYNTIGEYKSKAINKAYKIDNAAFPSHFQTHDGHFLYVTKQKSIGNIILPGLKVDQNLNGVLRLRIKNRRNELPLGLIWNTDTIYNQQLAFEELLDVSMSIGSLSSTSNSLSILDLDNKLNFNLVYYFIDYPQVFDTEFSVVNTQNSNLRHNYSIPINQSIEPIRIYSSHSDALIIAEPNAINEALVDLSVFDGDNSLAINYGNQSLLSVSGLGPARFLTENSIDYKYLMLSTKSIPNLEEELLKYKAYRESDIGGAYQSDIVFYEDILNSFGYGIPRNFLAIKSFLNSLELFDNQPEDLFIIGKGRSLKDWRVPEDINNPIYTPAFIPTYGYHGSDYLLITKEHNILDPICNIGRLPITRSEQLSQYLDKVIQLDSFRYIKNSRAEDISWMNDVLHLGGGRGEAPTIKAYLDRMQDTIEQSSWDADVTSFYKTTIDPIQNVQSEDLRKTIDNGLSLLTFFGHSSTGSFDFKLEDPSTYLSNGKYSLMYSLGCLNGDIHSVIYGIAEQFVLEPNAGSIAYFGSTGYGFLSALNLMGLEHYKVLANEHNIRLGELNNRAISNLSLVDRTGIVELREQFVLAGDPVIEVGPLKGKDYTIAYSSVNISDAVVSLQKDSFDIEFDVFNLGELAKEELTIHYELEQNGTLYNLGEVIVSISRIKETIKERLKIPSGLIEGSAFLHITLDPNDEISESPLPKAESNNRLGFSRAEEGYRVRFSKSKASILSPPNYAIVTDELPNIVFQTDRLFSDPINYICQIDTVLSFDSGLLLSETIQSNGGAIKWNPSINWNYNQVYYIRVSIDKSIDIDYNWDERSFVYRVADREGWNQSHIDQFVTLDLSNIHLNSDDGFSFAGYINDYSIRNFFFRDFDAGVPKITLKGSKVWTSLNSKGIGLVLIDDERYEPISNIDNEYGSVGTSFFYWSSPDTLKRRQIMEFMDERVKDGQYVIFMPVRSAADTVNFRINEWGSDSLLYGRNLFQMFENEGAEDIRSLVETPRPYVFVYRKGYGKIREESTFDLFDEVKFTLNFEVPIDSGLMTTIDIGPSKMFYDIETSYSEKDTSDIIDLKVTGVKNLLDTSMLLIESIDKDFTQYLNMSGIDSSDYLNLEFTLNDTSSNTIPQLKHLRVYYESFPEFYYLDQDSIFWLETLVVGKEQKISYYIGNYSAFDSDSLLVKYTLKDELNQERSWTEKYQSFNRYQEAVLDLEIETWDLKGSYRLLIELNPNSDQKELVEANNFARIQFEVKKDNEKPILSVLFDGLLMPFNGFVNANPIIEIELRDLNSTILFNDTMRLKVFLKMPEDADFTEVLYSNENLVFIESQELGTARAKYKPIINKEGTYSLKVIANDGNELNELIYEVDFKYVIEPLFSRVELYPNPAVSQSYLSFFLEGSEVPEEIRLQLWNNLGQEITNIDLTNSFDIKLGKNEFLLDFKDRSIFDNTFPTGNYHYKIKVLDENGQDFNKGKSISEFTGQLIIVK